VIVAKETIMYFTFSNVSEQQMNTLKHVIFDLDNCLANDEWRCGLIDHDSRGQGKYTAYHDSCSGDDPGNVLIFRNYIDKGVIPVFLTGRPVTIAAETAKWIKDVLGYSGVYHMIMRNPGDGRDAPALKSDQLDMLLAHYGVLKHTIIHAFDDRQDVVDMYLKRGIPATRMCIHDGAAYERQEQPAPPAVPGAAWPFPSDHDHDIATALAEGMALGEKLRHSKRIIPVFPTAEDCVKQAEAFIQHIPVVVAALNGAAEACDSCSGCPASQDCQNGRGASETAAADLPQPAPARAPSVATILEEAAATFRERNAVYGSNYKMVGPLMAVLFPNGVPPGLVVQHHFHLFELILVKLSRFAVSGLTHLDSVHDLTVYGAMIESILREEV
jgi:hypothetical protein